MSETWKRWEGQVVNGEFPLLRYLGGSDHSAVFLTERRTGTPQKAAIKLVCAGSDADTQLGHWKQTSELFHPHLVRLFEAGRCEQDGTHLLYVVMESAEEDLSQILPERALSPAEVREMLPPVLEALSYVHGKGLVHGRLRPSNILAAGDQVKVSSDSLRASGELVPANETDRYDAPEAASGKLTPAADVWSLGITLVEVLTQRRPESDPAKASPPVLPGGFPEPFQEMARRCLQVDPQQRWSVAEIGERLQPAKQVPAKAQIPLPATPDPGKAPGTWRYVVGLAVAALVIVAIVIAGNRSRNSSPTQPGEAQTQTAGAAGEALPESSTVTREPKPSPATHSKTKAAGSAASSGDVVKGSVLERVMPRVSQSARETIEGKIRVRVRVEVDPAGNVSEARLVSPGPSKYFARIALEAARGWKFTPAQVRGRAVRSEWSLRFGFRRTDTEVVPEQTSP